MLGAGPSGRVAHGGPCVAEDRDDVARVGRHRVRRAGGDRLVARGGRGGGIAGNGGTGAGDGGTAQAGVERHRRPSVRNARRRDREARPPPWGALTRSRRRTAHRIGGCPGRASGGRNACRSGGRRVGSGLPRRGGCGSRRSGRCRCRGRTGRVRLWVRRCAGRGRRSDWFGDRGRSRRRGGRRGRRRHGSRPGRKEPERVDVRVGIARAADAEMDARHGMLGRPAPPHRPDRRAFVDGCALLDADRAEVDERDGIPVRRLDRHAAAMRRERPGERHGSRGGCADRSPFGPGDVDATVLTARIRIGAQDERTEHGSVGGPCPGPGGRAECQRSERRHADNEVSVHEAPPSFTARATRVVER